VLKPIAGATRQEPGAVLITIALVGWLSTLPLFAQNAPSRPPQTDQTVAVTKGVRLSLDNFAGEVVIRGWDRDSVRVQARHASGTRVSVRTTSAGVVIAASGSQGPAGSVDYEINVPVWMPVKIDGTYAFVSVEGTQSEVAVETIRGDVTIKGGGTSVSASSVEGVVSIEGARGRINANAVNQGVTINGASGDILAESINGSIAMTKIESENVDASSVNGNIRYEGTPAARGKYRFTTHNGNILAAVPETASAAFTVRTYNGTMNTNLPLQGEGDVRKGRRVVYTLGSGGADFELESFGGTIQIRRPGTLPPLKSKEKD
jgi:DUF4097 and DUF4098 domain-containing protein YvlB